MGISGHISLSFNTLGNFKFDNFIPKVTLVIQTVRTHHRHDILRNEYCLAQYFGLFSIFKILSLTPQL